MFSIILGAFIFTGQENLPSIEELQQKRDQLQMRKDQFKSTHSAIPKLEEELKAAETSGNEDLIKEKKAALEAARKQRQDAFEGLQEMRKDRREDIPGYKDFKKEVDKSKATETTE